jgi:hypothetical protein
MNTVDRRLFLRTGIAGTTAVAFGGMSALGREREDRLPREGSELRQYHESLIVEPGLLTRSTEGAAGQRSLWAFPSEAESLFSMLIEPFTPDFADAETWANINGEGLRQVGPGLTGAMLDAIAMYPPLGASVSPEVVLRSSEVLTSVDPSVFTLDFLPQLDDANPSRVIETQGLPLLGASASRGISGDVYTIAQMFGWRLQYRPPHVHSLGSCERSQVNHIHLEIMRQDPNSPKRWPQVMTLHLGVYRSSGRKCLVLYNSPKPNVCWKVCQPTWNDLQRMLAWALVAAAAIAGVVLAGWAIAAISGAAASALYVPVLIAL